MERETTWSRIGTIAEENDFNSLLKAADLDYEAVARDLYVDDDHGNKLLVPGRKMIVREDTNQMFGIVSDRYQICQNRDALDFVQYIDGIELMKAGSVYDGTVYMIGQLPEVTILDDAIRPNLIFSNSHDGSSSIKATICMLRLVCQNQFVAAFKDSPATMKISHLGNMEEKLAVAKETMLQVFNYLVNFKAEATELATAKLTPTKFNKILERFFATNEENSDFRNQRIEEERDMFMRAYKAEDNQNFVKTKWGLVNAYSDFITHAEPLRKRSNWEEYKFFNSLNPATMTEFIDFVKAA